MSDYRQSANKRRDTRQAKVEVKVPSGSKKDTKRWCRGKVGVEHEPVCVDYNQHKRTSLADNSWKILLCSKCKKELEYWWPPRFPSMSISQRPPPAWVVKAEPEPKVEAEPEPKLDPLRNNPVVGFMSEAQAERILEEMREERKRGNGW